MSLLLACVYVYHMKPEKGIGFSRHSCVPAHLAHTELGIKLI